MSSLRYVLEKREKITKTLSNSVPTQRTVRTQSEEANLNYLSLMQP